MTNMKVMHVLFARWKGATCTTEHATHVLSTMAKSSIVPLLRIALANICSTYDLLASQPPINIFYIGVKLFRTEILICIIYRSHSLHFFFLTISILSIREFLFLDWTFLWFKNTSNPYV